MMGKKRVKARGKKKPSRRGLAERRNVLVLSILVSLVALVFLNAFVGFVVYPRYQQVFGSGFEGVLNIYDQYPEWIDFIIFLTIFLGLGKGVFSEHLEGKGATAVYTGLGIFLAIALLVWERNAGITLVELFGPFAFLFLLLIFNFYIYKWVRDASDVPLLGVGIATGTFYSIFLNFYCYGGVFSSSLYGLYDSYSYSSYSSFPLDPCGNPSFIYILIGILIVVGIARLFKK